MIKKVVFNEDHFCFKKDDRFEFRPGINLIVGDQGTGKSTLLKRLRVDGIVTATHKKVVGIDADAISMMAFDFEKDTPRGKSTFDQTKDYGMQAMCLFMSHGEMNNRILKSLEIEKDKLFILDEPDMALSIRSCYKLVGLLKKAADNGCQVLAAVHHPIVIGAFNEVLSLEHRKWMQSEEFILSQKV